ncbi:Cytochrome p450 [Thalictrum thalictroides]|uniref:Cytochrome p450 n=1 Tax=Thalictrum thalictroides TaxID=46969 RepID=A0A7J6WH27_THATH|nr:Cytochrome p450 [Thalictrum thalictroides]
MELFSFVMIMFTLLACLFSFYYLLLLKSNNGRVLPPSPFGLPLLGHLHMLSKLPHQNLARLAKKYGPIMSIRLGLVPAVVVTSPEAAELFLKTHDVVFASRPKIQVADVLAYGQKNLAFAQYGPYWRNIRKLCTIELLSSSKIESFKPLRRDELFELVKFMINASESRSVVDVTAKIQSFNENMTYRMICGSKDESIERNITMSNLREGIKVAGALNVGDFIPWLAKFDIQGLSGRMKACNIVIDGCLETIIDKHVRDAKQREGQHMDFIDAMLSLMESNNTREMHLARDHIKAIVLDMFLAAMDTNSTAIGWVIAELVKNPRVMKLVQEELENVVGLERMVEETDIIKLSYLKMVIMESMRIHPVGPLLLPHESTEDITINGYFIPKKSRVLINTWAIGRDPNVWSSNVQEFYPERFISTSIDVQGRYFQFLPFGSGRRMCPGMQLAMTVVQLVVAQLVHCFHLELPNGMSPDDLDMTEKYSLTLARANHLMVIPTYRLAKNLNL